MMLNMENIEIEIAQGSSDEVSDILRCLRTLYASREGEQALDREFGIDYSFLDYPVEAAQPMFTAEVVEKTARYEKRARVLRVEWLSSNAGQGNLMPKVVIEIV